MLLLNYPDVSCRRFFKLENTFMGPIDPTGQYSAVVIDMPLSLDVMISSKGIWKENNVEHTSFEGEIDYYPILADCFPKPTAQYPHSVRIPHTRTPGYVDIVYGFGCPNIGARVFVSPASPVYQTVRRNGSVFELIRLIGQGTDFGKCGVYSYTVSFKSWSNTNVILNYSWKYSRTTVPSPAGLGTKELSYEAIMATYNSVGAGWSVPTQSTKTVPWYETNPSIAVSPGALQQNLEHYVNERLTSNFPIESIDYGDLAARAVKQKIRLDVNLFEVLRELPQAKEMIPKLKNLTKLKTHTGNFLAVKYGVLPTISDLESIVGAFKSRIPYTDRFRFEIFNASNKADLNVGSASYSLKQYIKVAVQNEDSQFVELLNKLEDFGFALTFSNAWDLVKLSFVLDWFIDVGGFLERIDQNLRLARYNIPYTTCSYKKTIKGEISPLDGLAISGPIQWRNYKRWVKPYCPLPPLTLSTTPTIANHWLEAGALLLQCVILK